MKTFLLLTTLSLSTTTFASSQLCSFDDIQTLQAAQGPQSARVSEFLSLESPNFRCTLSVEHFVFPEDCGRFTFSEKTFVVINGAKKLKAVVRDGGISCTSEVRVELVKARFSKI